MNYEPSNFIEDIIVNDLESGKHSLIYTRFPPEPNGYLHVGHSKSLCINFGIKEKFNGMCNLRFDDTNPTKEDVEYVESIKEDIKWLGFEWDKELYASDYFEQTYQLAENSLYTISGNKQTNAGNYTVTVSLKDKNRVAYDSGIPFLGVYPDKT